MKREEGRESEGGGIGVESVAAVFGAVRGVEVDDDVLLEAGQCCARCGDYGDQEPQAGGVEEIDERQRVWGLLL